LRSAAILDGRRRYAIGRAIRGRPMDFVYIAVGFAVLGAFVLYAIGLRRV
jgi:hypothetical protein